MKEGGPAGPPFFVRRSDVSLHGTGGRRRGPQRLEGECLREDFGALGSYRDEAAWREVLAPDLEATSGKVSVNRNALVDLGPIIRNKVKNYMADYLSSIQDI